MAFTLNDVSNILLEVIEVAIHNVLFIRKLYPDGIFALRKKFGVPTHVSIFPELNSYITDALTTIKHVLEADDLKRIDVCFYSASGQPLDRIVFDLKATSNGIQSLETADAYLIQLRESFRALCLKLAVNASSLPPLNEGCYFKILIHTTETTSVSLSENTEFQNFPWIETEKNEMKFENSDITPIKCIEHDLVQMNVYLEESKTGELFNS